MGFRVNRTYVLQFSGAMEGAYVKIKATPVEVTLEMRSVVGDGLSIERAAELLAEYVLEWNLDGMDDQPLPVTAEAIVGGLEQVVITKILLEWYKAAVGATAPLDPPAPEDVEPDIPMETVTP